MYTLHLKYPLVVFGYEGSALTLPPFLLSPRIIMLCHCSSLMTKDYILLIYHGTKWPFCVEEPLNTCSFIDFWAWGFKPPMRPACHLDT